MKHRVETTKTRNNLKIKSLLRLEQVFQSIFDALSTHIAILDDTGTIVSVNRVWWKCVKNNNFAIVKPKISNELVEFEDKSDPSNLTEIINLFFQIYSQRIKALHEALSKGDVILIEKIAHCLRLSSISLGASQFSAICKELEHKASTNSLQDAEIILNQLEHEFIQVLQILKLETTKQKTQFVSV